MRRKSGRIIAVIFFAALIFYFGIFIQQAPEQAMGASFERWKLLETTKNYIERKHVDFVDEDMLVEGAKEGILEVLEYYEEEIPEDCLKIVRKQLPLRPLSDGPEILSFLALHLEDDFFLQLQDDIINGALYGMMGSLDSYSGYMPKDRYEEMQLEMEGEYGGVGVVITLLDSKVTVQSIFKNTPGSKVDISPGDVLLFIDDEPTEGLSLDAVAKRIRGVPGTKVSVTLYRPAADVELTVTMTRAVVQIPYVEGELLDNNIGLITLTQFAERVGEKTYSMARDLIKEGADKIILDLRNNPGGLLTEAVNVASIFMPWGPVVHIADRGGVFQTLRANMFYRNLGLPLVVLVNKGSASGSEIVAAAIQEQGTGILIGTDTFGKGSVQTIFPLNDGSALRLTTAKYYTSKKNYIHETGISPDLFIELDNDSERDLQLEAAIDYLLDLELEKAG